MRRPTFWRTGSAIAPGARASRADPDRARTARRPVRLSAGVGRPTDFRTCCTKSAQTRESSVAGSRQCAYVTRCCDCRDKSRAGKNKNGYGEEDRGGEWLQEMDDVAQGSAAQG